MVGFHLYLRNSSLNPQKPPWSYQSYISILALIIGFITSISKPFGYLFVTLATDKPIENGFTTS